MLHVILLTFRLCLFAAAIRIHAQSRSSNGGVYNLFLGLPAMQVLLASQASHVPTRSA